MVGIIVPPHRVDYCGSVFRPRAPLLNEPCLVRFTDNTDNDVELDFAQSSGNGMQAKRAPRRNKRGGPASGKFPILPHPRDLEETHT